MATNYDYIIIGAGSAGCVLANRLTATGDHNVLLIEAGPKFDKMLTRMPMGIAELFDNPKVAWLNETKPSPNFANREMILTQGKMLGGGSSINAHVYTRGQKKNFDDWAAGPLRTTVFKDVSPLTKAFIKAGQEAGFPFNPDTSTANNIGVGYTHTAIYKGQRQSTYKAFLEPVMDRSNLTVKTGAYVHKILFDGKRAVGVDLGDVQYNCTKEVIVSAGAIGSPQILQHSGIGDPDHLQSIGINVVHAAPEVGKNLQDHLFAHVKFKVKDPKASINRIFTNPFNTIKVVLQWIFKKEGIMTMPASAALGFLKSDESQPAADAQMAMVPYFYEISPKTGKAVFKKFGGMTISAMNVTPHSKGEVKISSNNPKERAVLDMNYFSDDRDIKRLRNIFKQLRVIAKQPAMTEFGLTEILPGPEVTTDEDLEKYFRNTAETIYHPVGTCRMGSDATAVVDPQLQVKGIEGLRVIDASIMPSITTGNTNAPAIMIGEKGADLILGSNKLSV